MLGLLEKFLKNKQIKNIYELGPGWGIWGNVLRVQIGFTGNITAWEKWKPYADRLSILNVYDRVFNSDALNFPSDLDNNYLVLVPDILEHLEDPDLKKMLDKLDTCKNVIITTPLIPKPEEKVKDRKPFYGNPLNLHINHVDPQDLKKRGYTLRFISLRYFPRWLKPFIWIREQIRGVALAEYEILAYKGLEV
jgi:hypothetical protein